MSVRLRKAIRQAPRREALLGAAAVIALLAPFLVVASTPAADPVRQEAERLLAGGPRVLTGRDGWLFLPQELRAFVAPRTWGLGERAPAEADPLPAILDFNGQLERAGVELILVPVPPKLLSYPERLFSNVVAAEAATLGSELAALQSELARQGVTVLDLAPLFTRATKAGGEALFCRTDTHWSPRGIDLAARAIAERIGRPAWLAAVPRRELTVERQELEIEGDLERMLPPASEPSRPPRERLVANAVVESKGGVRSPLAPWRESPVLLLGDSHVMVFHAGGDLHARGAGLPDHLALALGFPVDVVGVRGSGGTPSRVNLLRRGDNLAGKRVVVWVFAARELLAGAGWKKVPVVR